MREAAHERFELSGREIALIFLFWTALATLSAVNRLLGARDFGVGRVISSTGPMALAYLEAWSWAAFTPLIFWLSSTSSRMRSRPLRVVALILAGIAIAIAVYLLLDFARATIIDVPVRRRAPRFTAFAPLREIGRFRFLNQLIIYGAVLAAGFAREYSRRDGKLRSEALALAADRSRLEAQLADARLDALRMQLNPHFLFNTLHAISALVERDPAGVRKMIARLSELLRHTIESRGTDEITLRGELEFLQRYIEIMEVRFQGRLRVTMSIADDVREALVPNLILQPLVENAFEHGAARVTTEAHIDIAATRDGDTLLLTVSDNGPGLDAMMETGVGLANTRARLAQLYGDDASLSLEAVARSGVVARIALPFHTIQDEHFAGRDDV